MPTEYITISDAGHHATTPATGRIPGVLTDGTRGYWEVSDLASYTLGLPISTASTITSTVDPYPTGSGVIITNGEWSDGTDLRLCFAEGSVVPGNTDPDKTWYFGTNISPTGGRVDATRAAVGISFAIDHFNYGGEPYGNLGIFTIAANGAARPFLSFEWPQNAIAGTNAQGYIHAQQFAFYNWAGTQALVTFNSNSNKIFLGSSTTIQAPNNVRILEAVNAAASASVDLITLDTSDRFRTGAPLYVNLPSTTTQNAINVNIAGSALANNYAVHNVSATGTTGALIYAYQGIIGAPGGLVHLLQNQSNATNAGTTQTLAALYGNSGCDVKTVWINYNTPGTAVNYAAGIDISAAAWKLSASTALGTNDRITVDANTVAFGLPSKTPTYTVATLPAAATVGNAARAYVTDSTLAFNGTNLGTAVTGGSTNHTPVVVVNGAWVIG